MHYDPSPLRDATRWNYPFASRSWQPDIEIDPTYDYLMIPSWRPFYAVLEDIVRHGIDNPKHGTNCACLDTFSYELHAHVNRALPEIKKVWVDPREDLGEEGFFQEVPSSRYANLDARMRIAHVLRMVAKRL